MDQLDGNITLTKDTFCKQAEAELELNSACSIPVFISANRNEQPISKPRRPPVRKTVRRNILVLQSVELPVVMNLNPRSIYNKTDEFYLFLEQYQADVVCLSESWERDNLFIIGGQSLLRKMSCLSTLSRVFTSYLPCMDQTYVSSSMAIPTG